ncbi:MAG TPA: Trk system potassium transporter TrkA [Clostridiales bacterium]|nr:Trk system potassium transporter TrkA [Clostridiales bacterium]
MKIIIIGCGKVGSALAEQLDREGHDIVAVDNKPAAIHHVTDTLDVMGVIGNGASYKVLLEAGIEETDILISVTNSDELNILCCLIAKKAGKCHTIARVRSPQYNDEIDFIREELGISMTINPELESALELSRLIRLPSAIKIETFAKGKVELLKCQIPENSILDNMQIKNISAKTHCKVLVCAVERKEEVHIPSGDFILRSQDKISVIIPQKNGPEFFYRIGLPTSHIKDIMILGGGVIASYIGRRFAGTDVKVKIIEQSRERCEELSVQLPDSLIIHANGADQNVLIEEGLETTDAFASLTNLDEENILLSLYAQKKCKGKIFTKITRLTFDDIIQEMNLGVILNPKLITADRIIQYVRAKQNSLGSNVETLYKLVGDKVEAMEFSVKNKAFYVGVALAQLNIKGNTLVGCINRKGRIIIPNGQDTIQLGDTVIIVTTSFALDDLSEIFE